MYCEKMVLAVKVGGRVLREVAGEVFLPFGSEYSLMLKNMSGKRALVHVEIDGNSATDNGIVLDAGRSVDLERFIGGDLSGGRKFRFIEKTDAISDHRGDRVDDGFVRVTYQFEQPAPVFVPNYWYTPPIYVYPRPYWHDPGYWWSYTTCGQSGNVQLGSVSGSTSAYNVSCSSAPIGDVTQTVSGNIGAASAGITVEGSRSDQQFVSGNIGPLEGTLHSMVLRLIGRDDGKPVATPVTVKTKKKCSSCGKEWGYALEYCGGCGTFLK